MKTTQIRYRLYYLLRSKYRKATKFSYDFSLVSKSQNLRLSKSIDSYKSFDDGVFTFLNLEHKFHKSIDWNFLGNGKLWAYNLNYFEYLNQSDFNSKVGLNIINDFIENIDTNREGMEPFPISLRGISWIKFLINHNIKEKKIDDSLYAQYHVLMDNLEYHLLGNHLLENGFSLLFGAYYFQDASIYTKAKEILIAELQEQILPDGAHFELTPMYHQIMLYRVLDSLNVVMHSDSFEKELEPILREKAKTMLSWLNQISYKDGSIPHFNDSTNGIAPTSQMLFDYAKSLGVEVEKLLPLKESGYRVVDSELYELRVDVGEIGPSYIPGHAHSDTFNFELQVGGKPFIVDTGISTYESNDRRLLERQTSSHNTVKIGDIEQSQVWSSFRVAERANIISIKEEENSIVASCDGYKKLGIIHQREFFTSIKSIQIKDSMLGRYDSSFPFVSYIHFHPSINDIKIEKDKIVTKNAILSIKGSKNLQLDDFTFANGFNKLKNAKVVKITFESELLVEISLI